MKRFCFFSFVVVLSVYSINAHAVQFQQSTSNTSSTVEATYQQALLDARNDAETFTKGLNWFLDECCSGLFGPLYAVLDTPTPSIDSLLGKPPEYVEIYTDEFQAKTRAKRTRFSLIGTGTAAVVNLGVLIAALIIVELE